MPDVDRDDDETTFWRDQRTHSRAAADVELMRVEAGAVMCPDCHAAIDADCVNVVTGLPLRGLPCHPKRLTTARKANR